MSTDGLTPFTVTFHFAGGLRFFLPKAMRGSTVTRVLRERTSVKDAVEACGVPHPEIDFITCDGTTVGFQHQLTHRSMVHVFGIADSPAAGFGLQTRTATRFVADGHLGTLARDLRLLGFDVAYRATATDQELVFIALNENRALLTRDRRLLMHRVVRDGYCPRSSDPLEQITETMRRFGLSEHLKPYTRCLRCGAELLTVTKADVLPRLEPLTRLHFATFRQCSGCGNVYWPGSHFAKLNARIAAIETAMAQSSLRS